MSATTFKDRIGTEWDLTITVGSVKRVRNELNIDLLEATSGELLTRLGTDIVELANVLYVLVKPQADEREISDEQFGELLVGETMDHALTAFLEGLKGFFSRQGQRDVISSVMKKLDETLILAETTAMSRVDQLNAQEIVDEAERQVSAPETPGG